MLEGVDQSLFEYYYFPIIDLIVHSLRNAYKQTYFKELVVYLYLCKYCFDLLLLKLIKFHMHRQGEVKYIA